MIRAIAFDLDNTLVPGANWHRDALNLALQDFGAQPISPTDHLLKYNGLSTKKKLSLLAAAGQIKNTPDLHTSIEGRKQLHTLRLIYENCRPISRVVDTVSWVKWQCPLGVVTNCSRETALIMINLSGLSPYFDFVITNEDVNGCIKPHPRPYALAREKFKVAPREMLAIDDNLKGVQSATEAGAIVWFLEDFADLTIENLSRRLESTGL